MLLCKYLYSISIFMLVHRNLIMMIYISQSLDLCVDLYVTLCSKTG